MWLCCKGARTSEQSRMRPGHWQTWLRATLTTKLPSGKLKAFRYHVHSCIPTDFYFSGSQFFNSRVPAFSARGRHFDSTAAAASATATAADTILTCNMPLHVHDSGIGQCLQTFSCPRFHPHGFKCPVSLQSVPSHPANVPTAQAGIWQSCSI